KSAAQRRWRKRGNARDTEGAQGRLKTPPELLEKKRRQRSIAYVRARDADLPCISCGKPPPDLIRVARRRGCQALPKRRAASHLRFNLDNINAPMRLL
ncbi:MAG: recombination protein NinG, partial [Burkholderiales bacterium]|nr:recombination protein NinG [Burkholderiales bacterium]